MPVLGYADYHRFMNQVHRTPDPDACWTWLGRQDAYGYGRFRLGGKDLPAHLVAWLHTNGALDDGLLLDHACHTRALRVGKCKGGRCAHRRCVNPAHLEPVSRAENVRRADHGKGQPRSPRTRPGPD